MANGPTRLWMGLALGSVLIVGLSAGLLADRLLAERQVVDVEKAAPKKTRDAHPPTFHFDCPDSEATPAAATGNAGPQEHLDVARSEAFRKHRSGMTRRMARRLELEAEQVEALEPIVEQAMLKGSRYWSSARDEFCSMQREFHRQVSELLSPEQAVRFDEMRLELMERGRRRGDRDHDGHGRRGDGDSPGGCR